MTEGKFDGELTEWLVVWGCRKHLVEYSESGCHTVTYNRYRISDSLHRYDKYISLLTLYTEQMHVNRIKVQKNNSIITMTKTHELGSDDPNQIV